MNKAYEQVMVLQQKSAINQLPQEEYSNEQRDTKHSTKGKSSKNQHRSFANSPMRTSYEQINPEHPYMRENVQSRSSKKVNGRSHDKYMDKIKVRVTKN
mmetsp:Transcript_13256/g.13054  ORF Transcript_13256/g.13054 Transcript_13256/m.13054 type:complete len:99 (+) Transcript_13256:49-345(+)